MDLGSIHACVSACGARNGERGSQRGAVRGPDLHFTRLHVHAFPAIGRYEYEYYTSVPVCVCLYVLLLHRL